MAVRLESAIKRLIGNSADPKPTVGRQAADASSDEVVVITARDLPAGSTFLEEDTGNIWRWNGTAWTLAAGDETQQSLLAELRAMHGELKLLRLGMVLAGMCKEV